MERQNPYEVIENHVAQVERFIAFDKAVGTLRNIFGNSDIRETIKNEYGAGTVRVIDDYIERFVQNRTTNWMGSDGLVSKLMSDLSVSALTLKSLHQFLVQMTATTAMWANYNPIDVIKGAAQYATKIKETEKALNSSPTLKNRLRQGASFEFSNALRRSGVGLNLVSALLNKKAPSVTPSTYQIISNILYGAMRLGDASVARIGGGPIYWAEIAKGKTPEQALMQVNRLMETTQQSDDPSQMPFLYANNQYVYLFSGMFALQPLQLLGLAESKIDDFLLILHLKMQFD